MDERQITANAYNIMPEIAHLKDICGEDTGLIGDMIDGETNVDSLIGKILELILADEADVEGLKAHQRRVNERRHRLEARIGRLRMLLASIVTVLPRRSYRHPLALISAFDVDPRIIVQDESAIPASFWVSQALTCH